MPLRSHRPSGLLVWGLPLFAAMAIIGCGGDGGGGGSSEKSVSISPKDSRLLPNAIQIYTATLNGSSSSVKWSVVEPNGGTISNQGQYRAPAISGTYTIQAALSSDSSVSGTTSVIIDSGFEVTVTGPTSVGSGLTTDYGAAVSGTTNQNVTWSASAGSIDANGLFTAPATPGEVTITARSVADAGKSKTFTVTVAEPLAIVAPVGGTLALPGSTLSFSALVDGQPGSVTWSTNAGTINVDGVWTAPSTPVDATITATRQGDPAISKSINVRAVADVDATIIVEGKGEVVLDLRPDQAPNTCANFVSLINKGFYDGIIFHRYEPGFVIQGGDPLTKTLPLDDPSIGTGGPGYQIPFEANPLTHEKYALAMARSQALDSAGSQFYITLEPQPSLDGSYVVFGKTKSGTAVVDALRRGDKITRIRVSLP